MLAAQDKAVNVALLELDRPARRVGVSVIAARSCRPWWDARRARPPARFVADCARPARRGGRRAPAVRKSSARERTLPFPLAPP